MAVLVSPGSGNSDPTAGNAAPGDTSSIFGVTQGVFNTPLETDPGMAGGPNKEGVPPTFSTVGNALESFYGMPTDQLQQLEVELWNGGFYSDAYIKAHPNGPTGLADEESYNAYKTAVIRSAKSGQTLDNILATADQGLAQGGPGGAGPAGPPPPPLPTVRVYPGGKVGIQQTDPETIRMAANATAQTLLGRNLSNAEAQTVVDTVRSDEEKKGKQQAALDQAAREAQIQTNETMYGQGANTVQGQGGTTTGAAGPPTPQGGGGGGQGLTPQQRAQVAYNAGFRGQALVNAVAISMAEGDVGSINDNPSSGDYSVGPWQINYYGSLRAERTKQFGDPQALANDPQANANAAFAISGNGTSFAAWSTYKNGAYKANLPAAEAAAAPFLSGQLAQAGVNVQGVTPGGAHGETTDIFLQPTTQDISTPVTPAGATMEHFQGTPEAQEYGLQLQVRNFTQALHSMPGDTGATQAKAVPNP